MNVIVVTRYGRDKRGAANDSLPEAVEQKCILVNVYV